MKHLLAAAAIATITLLGMFVFPGHTWLQADTQIYAPMLERLWDPSLFANDLITSRPHLAWSLYDEAALLLRALTRLDLQHVLMLEQILFRALGVWGIYLIGRGFTQSAAVALLIAGIISLGATIAGPSVLTLEYEPVPRGFAVSLLLCGLGLAIHGETVWASVAASIAFLYHAPTTLPFWMLLAAVVWRSRRWSAMIPLAAAACILVIFARLQRGVTEPQPFFSRIDSELEALQRLRASYNWVSLWPVEYFWHYAVLWIIGLAAVYRLRHKMDRTAVLFFTGLPVIGMLSMPASYLLLEQLKWSLMPQLQPARNVLLVTLCATILCCLAAAEAVRERRIGEAFIWFLLPFLIPIQRVLFAPYTFGHTALIASLAAITTAAAAMPRGRAWAAAAAVVTATFAIPYLGKISNYATLHNASLDELAAWARASTAKDAVFLFPEPGKDLTPGIFRVQAQRAVYVDWKTGGQVNYFKDLAMEWWSRWQAVMVRHEIPAAVDYVVYKNPGAEPGQRVYENGLFAVVRVR